MREVLTLVPVSFGGCELQYYCFVIGVLEVADNSCEALAVGCGSFRLQGCLVAAGLRSFEDGIFHITFQCEFQL